ncbi:Os01g0604550, partial [Oryza sativa Japonica Group]
RRPPVAAAQGRRGEDARDVVAQHHGRRCHPSPRRPQRHRRRLPSRFFAAAASEGERRVLGGLRAIKSFGAAVIHR